MVESVFDSLDLHDVLFCIEAGLMHASQSQHEWFMGEKVHHSVSQKDAQTNWMIYHHTDFSRRFNANKRYIQDYVKKHRDEIPRGKRGLEFTSEQFNHLILQDHSDYRPVGG